MMYGSMNIKPANCFIIQSIYITLLKIWTETWISGTCFSISTNQ